MTNPTFNKGDTVYNIEGQQGEYLMAYEDAHLVLPQMREADDDSDDAPYFREPWPGDPAGAPAVWQQVFAKPPVPVVHAEVAEARAELDDLNTKIEKAQAQLDELQAGERDRLARLKEHRQLARIDEWMAGKVTHFVVWERSYGSRVEVKAWAEVMDPNRERGLARSKIPLLVLAGSLEYDHDVARTRVDWCLVSDGDYIRCIPCGSEAEAKERAKEALLPLWAQRKNQRAQHRERGCYDHETEIIAKAFRKIGLAVPVDLEDAYNESRKAAAATSLELARKKQAEADTARAEAEAEALAAGLSLTPTAAVAA